MASLHKRCRKAKKASSNNPNAGHGLDKFALVSTELQANKEELAAAFHTPLSMVKFTIGSHTKWVPINLSRSTKRESNLSKQEPRLGPTDLLYENTPHDVSSNNEPKEIFSAHSEAEAEQQITRYGSKTHILQGGILQRTMNALVSMPWVVRKASTIASNVALLKWHAKAMMTKTQATARKAPGLPEEGSIRPKRTVAPKGESINTHTPSALSITSTSLSSSPLDKVSTSPAQEAFVLLFPSSPAPVKTMSKAHASHQVVDDSETIEGMVFQVQAVDSKQPHKCKVKQLLKFPSMSRTPRNSPKKRSTTANALPKTSSQDIAEMIHAREVQSYKSHTGTKSCLATSWTSDIQSPEKERAKTFGQALAAVGLLLSLSGLLMGYTFAILGVVCWWYVLPNIRKSVGDKPVVASHHHLHYAKIDVKSPTPKAAGKNVHTSKEYKKRVIVEGLLDRGQPLNA